jgi:hypothetical protein
MREAKIAITDNGFTIFTPNGFDIVSLEQVSAVVAYKLDELTTDLVCCDIVTGSGDGEQIRTIHEELAGFDDLMAHLEILPGFDRKWREAVILPPFAENRTILYERGADAV